jgi:aromatic ring-opening dioxygenase catalytic subunit (LigB family)
LEEQAVSVKGVIFGFPKYNPVTYKNTYPMYQSVVISCHSFSEGLHTVICSRQFKYEYDSGGLESELQQVKNKKLCETDGEFVTMRVLKCSQKFRIRAVAVAVAVAVSAAK